MKMPDIQIFIPIDDDEKLHDVVLQGKMTFATFHQTKGLERKVVIVYSFDSSYFKFYGKNLNPLCCPNTIYVACTRAKEQLSLIHHYANNYFSFIKRELLPQYCDMVYLQDINVNVNINVNKIKDEKKTYVKELLSKIKDVVICECYSLLKITKIRNPENIISVPLIVPSSKKGNLESVSEINGTAIPSIYEIRYLHKSTILKYIQSKKLIHNTNNCGIEIDDEDIQQDNDDMVKLLHNTNINYNIHNFTFDTLTTDQILYMVNYNNALKNGYIFKVNQITDYSWLSEDKIIECMNRMNTLNLCNDNIIIEKCITKDIHYGNINVKFTGFIDIIDINDNVTNVYEIKCMETLDKKSYLQLALYMYLYKQYISETGKTKKEDYINLLVQNIDIPHIKTMMKNKYMKQTITSIKNKYELFTNNMKIKKTIIKYFLYNILSNELVQVECSDDNLQEIVNTLIRHKYYSDNSITDTEFNIINENIKKQYNVSNVS